MEKSLAKNAIFNVMYKALTVVFPLITITYASRILGPSGIGKISSAQNIVTYFTMFASLGIPQYGVRAIVCSKRNKKECDTTFTELFLINLMSSTVCCIVYFGMIIFSDAFKESLQINMIFSTLILLNVFNIDWVYRAFEEYQYIAIRSFIIKLISLVLLVFFVNTSADILKYACIVCFGTIGNYILNVIQLRKKVSLQLKNLHIFKHMRPIFTFFAAVIAVELYSLIDITMLTYMTSSEHVGYYSNAAKIIKTFSATITAIGAVLLPRLSLYYNANKIDETEKVISKVFKIILMLTIPSMIGLLFTADKIIFIGFGEEFMPAANTIRILSPLVVFMPISGGIGAQVLQTTNNEKLYMYSVYIGAIVNLVLNIFLIGMFQENGAAIASTITEGVVTIAMLYFSYRILRINIDKKFCKSIGISTVVMTIMLTLVNYIFSNANIIFIFLIEVLVGVASYFVTLFFFEYKARK